MVDTSWIFDIEGHFQGHRGQINFCLILKSYIIYLWGLPFSTYAPRGGVGGSSPLYISIAYYMQKGGEGVQIACKIAYVLNGRPLSEKP